jgi:hypothetical protein
MAHFYGTIDSHGRSKTDATRQGSKDRGMSGYVSGWDIGGKIVVGHNSNTDLDWCEIYATGGSNGGSEYPLARLIEDKHYKPKIYVNWHLDKIVSEKEYIQLKEDIATLIHDHETDPKIIDPINMLNCNLIAEAILDQLNFKLDDPKKED